MTERRERDNDPLSSWTVETLRHYIERRIHDNDRLYDQRFNDQQQSVVAALASADKALAKAEAASEKRFESQNEFRQTLTDQAATFMPRVECEQRLKVIEERLAEMVGMNMQRGEGKRDFWVMIGSVIALLGALGALGVTFFNGTHK